MNLLPLPELHSYTAWLLLLGIVFQAISVFHEKMRPYVVLEQKTKIVTSRSADTDYGMKNL